MMNKIFVVLACTLVGLPAHLLPVPDALVENVESEQIIGNKQISEKASALPQRITIDCILAYVEGKPIFKSDVAQPRIAKEGQRYTLDELIKEELWYQRAAKMHMLPSATDIDRQLSSFRIQNNFSELSDAEFESRLKEFGFTIKSYKAQLARLIAVENVKRAEMSEKIMVTTQEVESFYKDHPEYTKEEYHLNLASIDNKNQPADWEDLGWVAREDIGEKFSVVFSMKAGESSMPIDTGAATKQIIKLVDRKEKHLKTFDERYSDIERMLQKERSDVFVNHFEEDLLAHASITYVK
ncbi:MAG: SurA N-terminal domain-containing protein [Candidatus Babeliales bacterium]|jgi:parvulin-like peptidyl-prolyl isomerase